MFDDPQEEVKRLQEKLLSAEDDGAWLDRELEEAHRLLGDLPAAKAAPKAVPQAVPQTVPVRNLANNFAVDYEDEAEEAEDAEAK